MARSRELRDLLKKTLRPFGETITPGGKEEIMIALNIAKLPVSIRRLIEGCLQQ